MAAEYKLKDINYIIFLNCLIKVIYHYLNYRVTYKNFIKKSRERVRFLLTASFLFSACLDRKGDYHII